MESRRKVGHCRSSFHIFLHCCQCVQNVALQVSDKMVRSRRGARLKCKTQLGCDETLVLKRSMYTWV